MQIDGHIQALREDLVRVAALGDEATSRAADLLSVAIEASLARRIQDVLAEAALDLSAQLEPRNRPMSGSRNRLTGYGRS
jgi:hypothetical protein